MNQLRNAVEAASGEDGWAVLALVGHIITQQRPDFDSRNYGYAKLSDLDGRDHTVRLGKP